ncbi:MAG: DNA polymerase III subunit gamma/tau [SAR86 cluster bacterium]|jgi:DNA polymerase-3 subunit gamma/tau|nr:DNA polymerase III subunit gamma/tau [SAR86 cluster bacterium]
MSYQVLARKWRPNSFSEVVGQEHVIKALSNALDSNKIHQAYLLSGTRGVGKTTLGRILTKCLNCEEGLKSSPCNKCLSCEAINEGRFMDFQEVDAASRRGVEETQQLLETVMHMPSSSRYKVYLIDEVHMLSKHSFNALLKTLEEPPPHVVFILATTEPESVPATVLSRCLQFHLKNLTPAQLSERLKEILKEEGIKFDSESINQISRAGRGSLRDCLTIADQAIAFCNGKLTDSNVSEMLGTLPYDHVYSLIDCVINEKSNDLVQKLKIISDLNVDYQRLMDLLLEALQHMAIVQISPESVSDLNLPSEEVVSLANSMEAEEIQILYQIGLIAKRDLDLAPNIGDGFEMALLRMMSFLPENKITKESKKKEEKDEVLVKKDLKPKKEIKASDPEEKKKSIKSDISLEFLDQKEWNTLFNSLPLDSGTKQLISHCSFLRTEDAVVYFSMPKDKLEILNGSHREKFQDSLSEILDQECHIFFEEGEVNDTSPNKTKEKKKTKKLNKATKSIKNDPRIKTIISSLGGKIVESSITPNDSNE